MGLAVDENGGPAPVRGYLAFEHGGYVRSFELPEGVGKGQEEEEKGCWALHGRQGSAKAVYACPAVCWGGKNY
jgi:hypothetical protein